MLESGGFGECNRGLEVLVVLSGSGLKRTRIIAGLVSIQHAMM